MAVVITRQAGQTAPCLLASDRKEVGPIPVNLKVRVALFLSLGEGAIA